MIQTNISQLQLQLITGPMSQEEKEIIIANLDKTNGVIASMLNRSEGSIRKFLFKNRITRTPEQVTATKFFAGSKMRGTNNGNYKHGEGNNPYYYKRKHAFKNRLKDRARNMVYKAKRAGILIQNNICELCKAEGPTEFHHTDYSEPLQVQELCSSCHQIADVERQLQEQEEKFERIFGENFESNGQGNSPGDNI